MDIKNIIQTASFFLWFLLMAAPCVHAEEASWIVAGVDGGAWKSTDRDPSVRTAVTVGDAVRSTDRLETFQNNQVALALDPQGKDIVAVQGAFKMSKSERGGTNVKLERGKALAVLDGLKKKQEDFTIVTASGVAAVRGTRFSVELPASGMQVKTFQGEVQATAVAGPGARSGGSVMLPKGKKTTLIKGPGHQPTASGLSQRDWEEYGQGLRSIRSARKSLKSSGKRWFEKSSEPSRSKGIPSTDRDAADADRSGQTIVF